MEASLSTCPACSSHVSSSELPLHQAVLSILCVLGKLRVSKMIKLAFHLSNQSSPRSDKTQRRNPVSLYPSLRTPGHRTLLIFGTYHVTGCSTATFCALKEETAETIDLPCGISCSSAPLCPLGSS